METKISESFEGHFQEFAWGIDNENQLKQNRHVGKLEETRFGCRISNRSGLPMIGPDFSPVWSNSKPSLV